MQLFYVELWNWIWNWSFSMLWRCNMHELSLNSYTVLQGYEFIIHSLIWCFDKKKKKKLHHDIICGPVKLDDWLQITKLNLWHNFAVTDRERYQLFCEKEEKLPRVTCHVGLATLLLQIRVRCGVLPHRTKPREFWSMSPLTVMVHKHAGLPFWCCYKGGKSHADNISEGCFAGNSTQCAQPPVQLLLQKNQAVQWTWTVSTNGHWSKRWTWFSQV